MATLPSVTCVMTAFNYERYVADAITSVLAQDYPADLLDVVVVDDGSTDRTSEAVEALQSPRVKLVPQENAGLAAATATALRHAGGELIAICDADDQWLPGKVALQAAILSERPEVSLVYGDMQVIDADGRVTDSSFFRRIGVERPGGRVLDRIVLANCITNSTLMFRAAQVIPPPACSPFADYWLAAHAAAAGEFAVVNRPLANYRMHTANMGFGTTGERQLGVIIRELRGRRLILASLFREISLPTLVEAVRTLDSRAQWTCGYGGKTLGDIFVVDDEQRARSERELERAHAATDLEERIRAFALARLTDPFNLSARLAMDDAWRRHAHGEREVAAAASRRYTRAPASQLIAEPARIADYCERVGDGIDATLVIIADELGIEDTAEHLRAAMLSVGVDPDDCPDLMLIPADSALATL